MIERLKHFPLMSFYENNERNCFCNHFFRCVQFSGVDSRPNPDQNLRECVNCIVSKMDMLFSYSALGKRMRWGKGAI